MHGNFFKKSWILRHSKTFFMMLALALLTAPLSQAQKLQPDRPVLRKIGAKYPPSLRMNGIGGTVRLTLVIDARGSVQKITPVGGNPALVESSIAAVKQWKYAPADTSTKMEVQFAFVPDQQ